MKVKLNPMFKNVSGKLGDLVFREVNGTLVASRKPIHTAAPSAKQVEHRERFKNAAAYGRSAIKSEELRDRYAAVARERNLSLNAVMIADYFHAPVVEDVGTAQFQRAGGGRVQHHCH
jgi:hypothetical protein